MSTFTGIIPYFTKGHTFLPHKCDQKVSVNTESVSKDLTRVPWPYAILKFQLSNSFDYRVHYKTKFFINAVKVIHVTQPNTKQITLFTSHCDQNVAELVVDAAVRTERWHHIQAFGLQRKKIP